MTPLAAYLLLFVAVGAGFILVHLLAGKLVRPARPDPAKGTIYECGEPTIGSAWIQFDLRFYVVALLFVIFDVEVAFFFPWAEVFGKANAVASAGALRDAEAYHRTAERAMALVPPFDQPLTAEQLARLKELRARVRAGPALTHEEQIELQSLDVAPAAKAQRLENFTPEDVARLGELRAKDMQSLPPQERARERNELQALAAVESLAANTQSQARLRA
jgi:NADH-quinone oxidoreductase subunit A